MPTPTSISLVMTVRNEEDSLPRLLDSIMAQTLLPSEVIIVDGGSTDGTQAVIKAYMRHQAIPIRLIVQPGANISEGRNRAIGEAAYSILAVTDAGVRLDPIWLEALAEPLGAESVDVVSGFFVSDVDTPFERAMGATVLPSVEDVDPQTFLPSSRSIAFRKEAWESIGGYPEWLDYCEDLVFDMRLKSAGHKFAFAPDALVYFRPRSTLLAFFHQYFRYARGDGKANLWRKRHAVRYATYTIGPLIAGWGWKSRSSASGKFVLLGVAVAGLAYCRRPYTRLLPMLNSLQFLAKLCALTFVPVIRIAGDVAKMLGYPVGVLWRIRNRP